MQEEGNCMARQAHLFVECYMNIMECLVQLEKLPVTNLPPREIVPPVITKAWFASFPMTERFDALTKYVVPFPHAIPKSFKGLL